MSEYKLHNLITELLNCFGEKKAEEYINYVQSHMNQNVDLMDSAVPLQNIVQQLAQSAENSDGFLSKFEELKSKNVDGLSPFTWLLHSISQDTHIKDFLSGTSKKSFCPKVDVTKNSLTELKHKLKEAIIKPSKINSTDTSLLNQSKISVDCALVSSSWILKRPSMSWDFPSRMNLALSSPMDNIPSNTQENVLIEDLLNVFMGLPGCHIEPLELKDSYDEREFSLNESIDASLKELVKKMLPLASHYSIAQRFVEEKQRFEFGQVNNALAERFHTIIIDYTLFVTQLETEFNGGNLNMIKMWYFVQKKLHSMGILANIATAINKSNARGGKVLSLLHENITTYMGDTKAQSLCITLIEAACVPYMKILEMWIHKGIIVDPIHEFLVEDNEIVQREDMPANYSADYWDKKYTIRRERIPKFLESISDIILRAGKYLNVIRQCGKTLNNEMEKIEYKVEEKHYLDAIQRAYTFASKTLLKVVLEEQDLLGRLKSVKHYFLLDKGDFIVTFFTLCEKEFHKNLNDVIPARLESLLDLALRLSSAIDDPYKEDLQAKLLSYNVQTQMLKILRTDSVDTEYLAAAKSRDELTVIESFTFGYEVKWPLSLILNENSLACYQIIFRYLFFCKYVERMLCQIWKSNKVAKRFPLAIGMQYRKPFALRQRMLHSVQHLEYHMMVEVIEPHWCTFQQKIAKVNNVDEILVCHADFLNSCLTDCMLTIPKLLSVINKLLLICVDFCKFMQTENVLQNVTNYQEPSEHVGSFEEHINKYEIEFTSTLMQLLSKINTLNSTDHSRLFNLLYRLDFNKHYVDYDHKFANDLKNTTSG